MTNTRTRDYFLTINESANCYNNILDIINENEESINIYALIKHNKDIDTDTGEVKKEHYHLMIEFKNAKSFTSIQKIFNGAHIESAQHKKQCYKYLLHNTINAKEKYQYNFNDIITNNIDYIKNQIESEEFETFEETNFINYIAQGTTSLYKFVKRFGFIQANKYWKIYQMLLLSNDNDLINEVNDIVNASEKEQQNISNASENKEEQD